MTDYVFEPEKFFPLDLLNEITDIRVNNPKLIEEVYKKRIKRTSLTINGRLAILAADHPARMVLNIDNDPIAMGNRHVLLSRIIRVLAYSDFDGIMAATDLIEELLLANYLTESRNGMNFLDNKLLIGCMNRGGLPETVFDLNDRITSYTAESLFNMNMDGAKFMFRLDPGNRDSGDTIEYAAHAINALNKYNLPIFLEPLPVDKIGSKYIVNKDPEKLIKIIGIAAALGDSSRNIWLKIPYCNNFETVIKSTTCPILILGGDSKPKISMLFEEFSNGLKAGKNIRGVLAGRNITYSLNSDPAVIARTITKIIHDDYSAEQAEKYLVTALNTKNKLPECII